jgi:hypothetical protein
MLIASMAFCSGPSLSNTKNLHKYDEAKANHHPGIKGNVYLISSLNIEKLKFNEISLFLLSSKIVIEINLPIVNPETTPKMPNLKVITKIILMIADKMVDERVPIVNHFFNRSILNCKSRMSKVKDMGTLIADIIHMELYLENDGIKLNSISPRYPKRMNKLGIVVPPISRLTITVPTNSLPLPILICS